MRYGLTACCSCVPYPLAGLADGYYTIESAERSSCAGTGMRYLGAQCLAGFKGSTLLTNKRFTWMIERQKDGNYRVTAGDNPFDKTCPEGAVLKAPEKCGGAPATLSGLLITWKITPIKGTSKFTISPTKGPRNCGASLIGPVSKICSSTEVATFKNGNHAWSLRKVRVRWCCLRNWQCDCARSPCVHQINLAWSHSPSSQPELVVPLYCRNLAGLSWAPWRPRAPQGL